MCSTQCTAHFTAHVTCSVLVGSVALYMNHALIITPSSPPIFLVPRACTATSLRLYDWFTLEDLSISLFFVAVDYKNRGWHTLGSRQPLYIKFVQGTCVFIGLILLLWVPLFMFSSGNPTFAVPALTTVTVNASMVFDAPQGALPLGQPHAAFSLFTAGPQWLQRPAFDAATLPASLNRWTPEQLQSLCLVEVCVFRFVLLQGGLLSYLNHTKRCIFTGFAHAVASQPPRCKVDGGVDGQPPSHAAHAVGCAA